MLRLIKTSKPRFREEHKFIRTLEPETGFSNDYYGHILLDMRKDYKKMKDLEKGYNLPVGWVKGTHYFLYEGSEVIGVYYLRPQLNESLRNGAGHIGYAIKKEYRNKGYGSIGLSMAIKELKKNKSFVDTEIYLSCYKGNTASLRVMQHNGGYIHHEDNNEYYVRIKV